TLLVDAYRSKKYPQYERLIPKNYFKHQLNISMFISFFPHLVAGPVIKAHDLIPQIKQKVINEINWNRAIKNLILGFFLKMVIADNLKDFTLSMQYPHFIDNSSMNLLFMIFAYSFQIFSDFAGYSLIAIGLALLFGYELMTNFNFPYISKSFQEFWRRWHISLSSFLKEYLYYPLGGNRISKSRTYLNLFIVMFLGGLWHGAAWSYAIWGSFHGLGLAIEKLLKDKINLKLPTFFNTIKMLWIFICVTFAWLLFIFPSFNQVIIFCKCLYNNTGIYPNYKSVFFIILYSLPPIVYHLYYLYKENAKVNAKVNKLIRLEPYVYGIMFFLILVNSGISRAFIYFQF
ncbi:MAG: MBOAT family protein, partial [Bacteroidales bacterium]|nr:MBOAT family protein [Bacteroidales bacterium]